MQFQLTDEQRALQDAVRSYLRDRFGPTQVRAVYEEVDDQGQLGDGDPAELWKAAVEQGWLALLVPEEHEGFGAGLLEACVVARAFGAGTVPGPWLGTVLAAEAVRLAGSAAQQAAWLPRLASGEAKGAVAFHRPGSSPRPAPLAEAVEGRLTGSLGLVEYAHLADVLVVAAQDGLYLVTPGEGTPGEGMTVERVAALDRTTRTARVTLAGAAGERLEASSDAVVQELIDRAAVLVANDLVGTARKALTDTVEYDKTRVQFGRPVGSFQAVKHELADLLVQVVMAEHAATYAAYAVDTDAPDRAVAVSIAKAKASDAARLATSDMIQYHGGIGYTWEHDAHFYFKRAKRLEYAYGDAAQHRERIATLVVDAARGGQLTGSESGGTAGGVQGTGVSAGATA